MTGVMTCVHGELTVESFDCVTRLSDDEWVVRALPRAVLRPGDTSTLTEKVRNIHRVAAPVSAQIIDIFSPPYDSDRTVSTRWFKMRRAIGKPSDQGLLIAEAQ
jgi:hypothetical protein